MEIRALWRRPFLLSMSGFLLQNLHGHEEMYIPINLHKKKTHVACVGILAKNKTMFVGRYLYIFRKTE